MLTQLISLEKFTSIQQAQAGLTKLFKKAAKEGTFYRVLNNNKPLGVLVPNEVWEDFLEDMEASASENFKTSIAAARQEKERYSLDEVMKDLGLE